jgi:hypothetical protein
MSVYASYNKDCFGKDIYFLEEQLDQIRLKSWISAVLNHDLIFESKD